MRVSLTNRAGAFSAAADQSLLDAGLAAGLNLPHGCKSGNCGACRARLIRGSVRYPLGRPPGLAQEEVAEGYILMCQARAQEDLELEPRSVRVENEVAVKRLPCRVERSELLAHDVMALYLRLPVVENFRFEPGQYVDVMLSGGRRRSFSIASPPHDSKLLELHVRRVAGGEFTERVFDPRARPALLTIEGPLGHFVYRDPAPAAENDAAAGNDAATEPGAADPPMLLIGGGTGIAPLISMLRHLVENGIDRDMRLYWGVRREADLYAQAALERLARAAPRLRYVPVLSDPDGDWRGRRGWVHAAVLADLAAADRERLDACDVYASGPPEMIAAVRRDFAAAGAHASRLFFDSFDYAPDALERQRTSAATKS